MMTEATLSRYGTYGPRSQTLTASPPIGTTAVITFTASPAIRAATSRRNGTRSSANANRHPSVSTPMISANGRHTRSDRQPSARRRGPLAPESSLGARAAAADGGNRRAPARREVGGGPPAPEPGRLGIPERARPEPRRVLWTRDLFAPRIDAATTPTLARKRGRGGDRARRRLQPALSRGALAVGRGRGICAGHRLPLAGDLPRRMGRRPRGRRARGVRSEPDADLADDERPGADPDSIGVAVGVALPLEVEAVERVAAVDLDPDVPQVESQARL